MIKIRKWIILISFLFLFSGCTDSSSANSKMPTEINKQNGSSEVRSVSFEYFYRGFVTLKDDQVRSYPHETYIIETDDDWHDFMDKYVPGIPYEVSVDYSKEFLVFDVAFPAKPTYSFATDIKGLKIDENKLIPEYFDYSNTGNANGIYAQNIDGIVHCFVNIVKMSKKGIPKDIKNIYHKGKTFDTE